MNCAHCGTSNLDNATLCINCGRPLAAAPPPPPRPVTQSYTPPPPPPNTFMDPPPRPDLGVAPPPGGGGTLFYIIATLVTVLCCCNPFAIVTLIFGFKAMSRRGAGDYEGAARNARLAAIWFWITAAITVVAWGLSVGIGGWDVFEEIRRNLPR